jgi:hypothetical protein
MRQASLFSYLFFLITKSSIKDKDKLIIPNNLNDTSKKSKSPIYPLIGNKIIILNE